VAESPVSVVDGPEAAVSERDWVRDLLDTLSPRERDVVACVDVVGLPVAEAARALGMTPVAVRVARHRALHRLRKDPRTAQLSVSVS
jgi:RNA polymerase sigma-70 factor (ECF subfamily)